MEKDNNNSLHVELSYIRRDIENINKKLDEKYVTQAEFDPIKKLMYGFVALVLVAVVGSMIALVVI